MNSITIKAPSLKTDVHPLIRKRWSPVVFSGRSIADEQMQELFEAASWAASAYNDQPWEYVYAHRGTDGFDQIWSCLNPGNQPWTQFAGVLFVSIQRNTLSRNGKPNHWASHDVGMANAQLLLQAVSRDIYGHLMAGFDQSKIKLTLGLGEERTPVCVGALGYLGDTDLQEAVYRSRDLQARDRRPVADFTRMI